MIYKVKRFVIVKENSSNCSAVAIGYMAEVYRTAQVNICCFTTQIKTVMLMKFTQL